MLIGDWRLQIADCKLLDWRLPIRNRHCRLAIAECRLNVLIDDCRVTIVIADWRLPSADCKLLIGDCRMAVVIGDCRLAIANCRLATAGWQIVNLQIPSASQSTISSYRQSTLDTPSVGNRQSTIANIDHLFPPS